ncbi:hypothetical protein [Ornithinimicrobium sufpigmenti]|uniref:hypothetical protein n=1 Tax=Ornithinimicrobium sufpigmenti TaxID=2508882 RepID=UPI00307B813A
MADLNASWTVPDAGDPPDLEKAAALRRMREGFIRMQMEHQFAADEVLTKVSILR